MKHHSTRMIFSAAVLAATILFAGPVQAEEKYIPPAPPPPDFAKATANVVAPPPVAPTAPVKAVPFDPNKKLPQHDTGKNIAPPVDKGNNVSTHDEKSKPKAKPEVKEPKSDSDNAEQPTE